MRIHGAGGTSSSPKRGRIGGGQSGSLRYWRKTATGFWFRRGISCRGSNWVQGHAGGNTDATRTIAVLSDAYWSRSTATPNGRRRGPPDPVGTGQKLLTVRVTAGKRPGLLSEVVGVDLFGLTEADVQAQLRP